MVIFHNFCMFTRGYVKVYARLGITRSDAPWRLWCRHFSGMGQNCDWSCGRPNNMTRILAEMGKHHLQMVALLDMRFGTLPSKPQNETTTTTPSRSWPQVASMAFANRALASVGRVLGSQGPGQTRKWLKQEDVWIRMSAPINILRNMLIPDTIIYHTPDCFLNTHDISAILVFAPQQLLLECYNVLLHLDAMDQGQWCWLFRVGTCGLPSRPQAGLVVVGCELLDQVRGLSWRKCLVLRVWVFFLRKCEGDWGVNFGMSDFFQLKIKLDVDITVQSFSQAVNSLDCGLLYHREI